MSHRFDTDALNRDLTRVGRALDIGHRKGGIHLIHCFSLSAARVVDAIDAQRTRGDATLADASPTPVRARTSSTSGDAFGQLAGVA